MPSPKTPASATSNALRMAYLRLFSSAEEILKDEQDKMRMLQAQKCLDFAREVLESQSEYVIDEPVTPAAPAPPMPPMGMGGGAPAVVPPSAPPPGGAPGADPLAALLGQPATP